ncbi:hypothetical protein [Cloacibacterium sp.]
MKYQIFCSGKDYRIMIIGKKNTYCIDIAFQQNIELQYIKLKFR